MNKYQYKLIGAQPIAEKYASPGVDDDGKLIALENYAPAALLSGGGVLRSGWLGGGMDQERALRIAEVEYGKLSTPETMTLCIGHSKEYIQQTPHHGAFDPKDQYCDVCGDYAFYSFMARPVRCECGSDLVTVVQEDDKWYLVQCLKCGHMGAKGHDALRAIILWQRERFHLPLLPTYGESERLIEAGHGMALHHFIIDNEPAGEADSTKFRNGLQAMIEEMRRPVSITTPFFNIRIDASTPKDKIHFEDREGNYLGRIVNIGVDLADQGGDTTARWVIPAEEELKRKPCPCGSDDVAIRPYGRRSHQVVCGACGNSGVPAYKPMEALRMWNDPIYEAELEWFPSECVINLNQVLHEEWKIGYRLADGEKAVTYMPGSGSYYSWGEALERAYRHFADYCVDSRPELLVPWMRPDDHGELPGGICCLRATGRFCYVHNSGYYRKDETGNWFELPYSGD